MSSRLGHGLDNRHHSELTSAAYSSLGSVDSDWQLPPRSDSYLQIRISRNTLIALMLSLIVHALLLVIFVPRLFEKPAVTASQEPITVQLGLPAPAEPSPPPAIIPEPEPKPEPKPAVQHVTKPKPVANPPVAPVIASDKSSTFSVPVVPPVPKPAPVPAPDANAPTDMMAYVNAARARRQETDDFAARENAAAVAKERGPSAEEVRDANIKRNLQQPGTNGVFQILSLNDHSGQFSFLGWTGEYSSARREVFEVEVGVNGDIQRVMVRKMIELIRRHYTGDFNWESQRLGHVVIKSARIEDNDELENFLLQEFFGRSYGLHVP